MNLDLQSLGFTKEELQQRVVDQVAKSILESTSFDHYDKEEITVSSKFARTIERRVLEHVDETINAMCEKHILPNVAMYIENLTLQATNQWGEKRGEKLTFVEYLTQRAEAYMTEKVDFKGRSQAEDGGGYGWKGTQTRLTHLVHEHLHYSIETAMKNALAIANSSISAGIQETVKLKLSDIASNLQVKVTTK